jgi:hypothetical protein
MANLRDRNDRAIVAYLKPFIGLTNIYPQNWSGNRAFDPNGLIDVGTQQGPESPPFSGCFIMDVRVRVKFPMALQNDDADFALKRVQLDALVDKVFDAMRQTDDQQTYSALAGLITAAGNSLAVDSTNGGDPLAVQKAKDNADMVNYTCLNFFGIDLVGAPEGEQGSLTFVELMKFKMLVNNSNGQF